MIFIAGAILEEDRVRGEFIHRTEKRLEENACSLMVAGSSQSISIFAIVFSAETREKAWLWRYSINLEIFQSWICCLRYLHDLTCLRDQLNKMANVLEYRSCDCQWLSAVPCGPAWVMAVLWSFAHRGQACWGKIYKFTVFTRKAWRYMWLLYHWKKGYIECGPITECHGGSQKRTADVIERRWSLDKAGSAGLRGGQRWYTPLHGQAALDSVPGIYVSPLEIT